MTLEKQFETRGMRIGDIRGTLQTLKNCTNFTNEEIFEYIQKYFNLTSEETKNYMKEFY